jgi:hypothetical protein
MRDEEVLRLARLEFPNPAMNDAARIAMMDRKITKQQDCYAVH